MRRRRLRAALPTRSGGPRSWLRPHAFADQGLVSGTSFAEVAESLGTDAAQAEVIYDNERPGPHKIAALVTALMASRATHYPYLFVYIQEATAI